MAQFCYITLCNPIEQSKQITLKFELYPTEIASKWRSKVLEAQANNYQIDDPERFYGFDNIETEKQKALELINQCIKIINHHMPLIERSLTDFDDQDTLNYLHHIFEIHHGLLDQQNTVFWNNAPAAVKAALANLNINIHRIESIRHGNKPRFVTTYFRLPKTKKLSDQDYTSLTNFYTFGGLYLNYVEIGKTLEELMRDQDNYIHAEAFKPWEYFSADFKVLFSDTDTVQGNKHFNKCKEYFEQNKEFFIKQGYSTFTEKLKPGAISLGQLVYNESKEAVLDKIKNHQYVKSVDF